MNKVLDIEKLVEAQKELNNTERNNSYNFTFNKYDKMIYNKCYESKEMTFDEYTEWLRKQDIGVTVE